MPAKQPPPEPVDEAPEAERPEPPEGSERLPPRTNRLRGIARRLFREAEEGEHEGEPREPGDREPPPSRSEAPMLTPPDGSSKLTEAETEEAFAAFESVAVSK